MKKATLETIRKTLVDEKLYDDTDEIIKELDAEINKGAAEKAAKAEMYESFHDLVMDNLSNTPVTLAELFADIEGDLPKGVNKHHVQYAVTKLWKSEVEKIEGKPNTYRKAA